MECQLSCLLSTKNVRQMNQQCSVVIFVQEKTRTRADIAGTLGLEQYLEGIAPSMIWWKTSVLWLRLKAQAESGGTNLYRST